MGYVVAIVVGVLIGWLLAWRDTSPRIADINNRATELDYRAEQLRETSDQVLERERAVAAYADAREQEYRRLLNESVALRVAFGRDFIAGRQWLADAFAEYIQMRDAEVALAFLVKPNPALKAAEAVADLSRKRSALARENKLLEYQLASYEEYFPVLLDYRDAILAEVVDLRGDAGQALENVDPALRFGLLTREEYEVLPNMEKFQLALDRYWRRDKSNVEIGRLYERYVGYLYEVDGWNVMYHGALKGFADFGRDLICSRGDESAIVQCKCWSKDKLIREKHVMQLFGTCTLYRVTEKLPKTRPILIVTAPLSDDASLVAEALDVDVRHIPLVRYPMVKCNISSRTGERIYHLPFDQQYDRVIIGDQPDELYATTVAEAEAAGFRRAFRWQSGGDQ